MRSSLMPATVGVIVGAVSLAGCGSESKSEAAMSSPQVAATPTAAGPVLIGKGVTKDSVRIDRDGPGAFSVRIATIPPGGTTGWHRHAGTETSVITKGEVALLREGACDPVVYRAGDAVFIPDGLAHSARNTGTEPAEIVVTYLLDPNSPDRAEVSPAC